MVKGVNWCKKQDHEIDYELVHKTCENPHPKGCANCEHYSYKVPRGEYFVTGKMPSQAQWIMIDVGLEEFSVADLTEFQDTVGMLVAALTQLQGKGLLKVKFVNEDEGPVLTFKAKDLLRELGEIT